VNAPVQFYNLENAVLPDRPLHLAIGMFDGVHLGHRAVLASAVDAARQVEGQVVVLTFWPHPSVFFRAVKPTQLLMTPTAKALVLGELGIDAIITQSFTPEFAGLNAEEFLPYLRRCLPQLAGVHVGDNWRFGRGRQGDAALLQAEGRKLGLQVVTLPRLEQAGLPISSTRIREMLTAGEMAAANVLLGRPYLAEGRVQPGKALGRTLGFPTLNLAWAPDLKPLFGVYVVQVTGDKSPRPLRAVANYGLRPTVEQATAPRLEVHLLEECPYETGDALRVEWLHFLRPEKKFSSVEELRAQIERDRSAAAADFSLR
jgi:riboflavin kinase/FMN adenylyltransferase